MPSTTATADTVAAVICTRNRAGSILRAVRSVLDNDHGGFGLTIVDQSTDDATREALAEVLADPRVTYVHTERPGLSRAYNLAIRSTDAPVLAFTDDDCVVPSDWIARIAAAFDADPDGDLLYGQVVPDGHDDDDLRLTPCLMFDRAERLSRRDGFRVYGMGANFAARRRLFERIGPFDEALGGGGPLRSSQDFDLAYRAYRGGSVVLLRPEVVVRHDGRREAEDWPALLHAYGFGDGAFYGKHIRCGDLVAVRLFLRRAAFVVGRQAKRLVRDRGAGVDPYLRGMVEGLAAARRVEVDRERRLYRRHEEVEVGV